MLYFYRRLCLLSLAIPLLALPAGAAVVEKETPRPFSTAQYVLLPVLMTSAFLLAVQEPPAEATWKGGLLFDDFSRGVFRMHSAEARLAAAKLSDILLYSLVSYPYVADALLDAGISKKDGRTAARIALTNTQAYMVTGITVQFIKRLTARERPFQQECAADPVYDPGCGLGDSRRSFFSGHAAWAFTGAGLICANHKALELAGGMAPCYVSLGLALLTGMTRVFADRHYASDVLVGAAVGLASGFVLTRATQSSGTSSAASSQSAPLGMSFTFGL